MLEGASGGPRLAYILEQLAEPRTLLAPLLSRLQALGHLRQFSERTLLHFLTTKDELRAERITVEGKTVELR
jgi:hypothetical protein